MRVVVPLAGPDFIRPDGSVKAEIVRGQRDTLVGVLCVDVDVQIV